MAFACSVASGGFALPKIVSQTSRMVGPGSSGMTRFGRPRGRFFALDLPIAGGSVYEYREIPAVPG